MNVSKHSSSFTAVVLTIFLFCSILISLVNCEITASKLPSHAKPIKASTLTASPKMAPPTPPEKDNMLIKVKPDPCSLQYVSVGLPTTGNFDHAPEDDGTFEANIRYGEAGDSSELLNSSANSSTVSSTIFPKQSNLVDFSESNPNSFLVYPTSVRVPLCTGVCGRTGVEARLHICQPTGSVVQEVLQVAQIIRVKENFADNSSSTQPILSSSVHMGRRQVKVLLHTGCRCACRSNPEERCPPGKWFNRERCRCECDKSSVDPKSCASRRFPFGAMFWDETTCQCRCPQLFSSYVRLMPPPKFLCPSSLSESLDQVTCRCVSKTKKNWFLFSVFCAFIFYLKLILFAIWPFWTLNTHCLAFV